MRSASGCTTRFAKEVKNTTDYTDNTDEKTDGILSHPCYPCNPWFISCKPGRAHSASLGLWCVGLFLACVCLAHSQGEAVQVRLRLVDAGTGKGLAGIVRCLAEKQSKPLELAGLFPRLRAVQVAEEFRGWHVVPIEGATLTLPPGKCRLEGLSGLETGLARLDVDLQPGAPKDIVLSLPRLFHLEEQKLVAGNTHLHLAGLSKEVADEYLKKIPPADGLRLLFISYLKRHKEDAGYITNRYPIGPLPEFAATGVLFNNGQEHRHNFKGYGEGYGHVMFLNIQELVKPVSIGPGITGGGFDDPPLRPGLEAARAQGGTVIWCHNTFGFEDVPSALAGRLDALNVFDGSRRGSYEENYYRYLNIGLHMPISTGTDWSMYDFSRVYARVDVPLTVPAWLEALKAGRCQATNGPLLSLKVNGRDVGDTLRLEQPQTIKIEAAAIGRHDFQHLQLVHNGKVVKQAPPPPKKPFRAELAHEMRLEGPGWFALRINSSTKNELGQPLFAHTSPVYVEFQKKKIFEAEAAQVLLKQVEESKAAIQAQGRFSTAAAGKQVLTLYDEAAQDLRDRINRRP